jgi:hypothetical protein
VPEELLDVPDIGSALEHVRRAAVPKQVAGALLSQPSSLFPHQTHCLNTLPFSVSCTLCPVPSYTKSVVPDACTIPTRRFSASHWTFSNDIRTASLA